MTTFDKKTSSTSLEQLQGIGARTLEKLSRLNIHSLFDLLLHFPIRYEDRTHITPIANVCSKKSALIQGHIVETHVSSSRRFSVKVQMADPTGIINLRFFHLTRQQYRLFMRKTACLYCFGEVREHPNGKGFEMVHPDYRFLRAGKVAPLSQHLTAIYSTVKGLHQRVLRCLIMQAFQLSKIDFFEELLPQWLLKKMHYPFLRTALHYIHCPPSDADLTLLSMRQHPAQQRLAFEELLSHRLNLQAMRAHFNEYIAPSIKNSPTFFKEKLIASLSFDLSEAQKRVISEIEDDLAKKKPMLRLIQGDVGSGKTVVAAIAIAQVIESGYQAAFMVPTEILAKQHYQKFQEWFMPLGVKVACLSGQLSSASRRAILAGFVNGDIGIAIGTHALFQKRVQFRNLALVVIDEQHRFGVHQRFALKEKSERSDQQAHQLIMTATPIPRTLSMTAYTHLDVSVINELPAGRASIDTLLVSNHRRDEVIERLRSNIQKGYQAYWVCNLIEESEVIKGQAAQVLFRMLKRQQLSLRIGLIHGRMKLKEKEQIMLDFKYHKIDLLIATTVVEVGIDIPNANLIVIENPERLGLAQLHQLRGRVGRSNIPSYCILLYQLPLSQVARARLKILRKLKDGFQIAEADLNVRGPGEVLGIKQSGLAAFRVANLVRDHCLLPPAYQASEQLRNEKTLCQQLLKRWIGLRGHYGEV